MKFNEAIENIGTISADVEGVPKKFSKIVRRKVPAGYVADIRKKKKKKEEKEDLDETAFSQMDPYKMQSYMTKFWKRGNGKMEEPDDEEEEEEDDEDEVEEMAQLTAIVPPDFKNKAIEPFWRKGKNYKKDDEDESDEDDEDAE